MVAVVSGNSLGLELTSRGVLGDQGVGGNAVHGQGKENVFVNAATGNLVMQQLQDVLVGAGLDIGSVLTYNSRGLANDDNADNFSIGKVASQLVQTNAVNTVGSTVTRTAFDGSQTVFTWDATKSRYQCLNGTGALDTLTYSATTSQYTWVDGSTQTKEVYDGATKRLLTRTDAAGNSLSFGYDNNGQLTKITDANGEYVTFVYSGNLLQQINAPVTVIGSTYTTATQPLVSYGYDSSNRLTSITVDLTPADGSTTDGNVYVTSFTYDGTSTRVHSMQQTDGTSLTFVYDSSQRVYTITDALSNVTTYTYDTTNRKTSVKDATGQTTVYGYDATTGLLTSVTAPTVNGVAPVTSYTYSTSGQVTSRTDPDGRVTSFGYDAAGNQTSVVDGAGNVTRRVYDAQNRVISETKSVLTRPALVVGTGMSVSSAGLVAKTGTTSAWNASVRSANSVTGAACVSFTAVTTAANLMVGLNTDPDTDVSYTSIDYALYLQQNGSLAIWSNGASVATLGTYAAGDTFSLSYDGVGNISVLKNGQWLWSKAALIKQPLYLDTSFYTTGGTISNLLFGSPPAQDRTLVLGGPVTVKADGTVIKNQGAEGWTGGAYSSYGVTGPAAVSFDVADNLWGSRMVGLNTDPGTDNSYASIDYGILVTNNTATVYTNGTAGQSLGTVALGDTLTTAYDGAGHVSFLKNGQVLYTLAATITQPLYADTSISNSGATIVNLKFSGVLSSDQTTRYVYDAAGKGLLRFSISAAGRVVEYGYDATGAVTSVNEYVAARYAVGNVAASSVPTEAQMTTWRAAQDLTRTKRTDYQRTTDGQITNTRVYATTAADGTGIWNSDTLQTVSVYDKRGDLLWNQPGSPVYTYKVDGLGRVFVERHDMIGEIDTTYLDSTDKITTLQMNNMLVTDTYDKAGRVSTSVDTMSGVTQASSTFAYDAVGHLLRTTSAIGTSTWSLYDADGRKVADIDATGAMTEYVLDTAGQITKTIAYANPVNAALLVNAQGVPINPALSTVRPTANPAADQTRWMTYDGAGRIVQTIDGTGDVTQYTYDGQGRLVATRVCATTVSVAALGSVAAVQSIASSPKDRVSRVFYDADGNVVGSLDADNFLTENQFDGAGQHVVTIQYQLPSTAVAPTTLEQARPPASASDQRSVTLRDNQGRVTGQVDALGSLTETVYNTNGTVNHTTTYATPVAAQVQAGATVASVRPTASAADLTASYTYDIHDRLKTATDGLGTVTTYTYEGGTSNVATVQVSSGTLTGGNTTLTQYNPLGQVTGRLDAAGNAAIAGGMSVATAWQQYGTTYTYDTAGNRTSQTDSLGKKTLYFYDADGRLRYTVDPLNGVVEQRYDAFGHVTASLRYVTAINPSGIGSGGLVTSGLTAAVNAVAALPGNAVTRTVYDVDGRAILKVDETGAAVQYTYDALGNVTSTRNYANAVATPSVLQVYDPAGQMNAAVGKIGTFANETVTASIRFRTTPGASARIYMDAGNGVLADSGWATSANGWSTLTITYTPPQNTPTTLSFTMQSYPGATLYDDLVVRGSSTGVAWQTSFDTMPIGTGVKQWIPISSASLVSAETLSGMTDAQLLASVAGVADDAHDLITNNEYNADGQLVWSSDAMGHVTRNVYDTLGRLAYHIAPDGAVTRNDYDTDGRVVRTTTFAGKLSAFNFSYLGHAPSTADVANAVVVIPAGNDAILARHYDALGRVTFTMDGTGGLTEYRYDVAGNVVDTIAYANKIQLSAWSTTGAPTPVPDNTRDHHIHASYDVRGNIVAQSDGTGAIIANTYDADGRLTDRIRYATRITPGSWTSGQSPSITTSADDIHERFAYDSRGQLTYSADGTGAITGYRYDANGNVTSKTLFVATVTSSQALSAVTSTPGADRVDRYGYDALNRQVWHADATNALDYTGYDADGRVTQTVRYALPNPGALPTSNGPLPLGASDRSVRNYYNALGQLAFTVDSINAVTANTYFQDGRLQTQVRYATPLAAGAAPSTVVANSAIDEVTQYVYDAAGHVQQTTNAEGGTQVFGYDGLGNKISFTNEKQLTWNYTYDGQSRLLTQTTPTVDITTNDFSFNGRLVSSPVTDTLVTTMVYDGVGNLRSRTEGPSSGLHARTTNYDYDAVGNQVSVAQPVVDAYDAHGVKTSSAVQPTTTTLYDAFGNAIANIDALQHVSIKSYDQANRLAYEVDANGFITYYARNIFGNGVQVTRYSTAQASLISPVPANAAAVADSAKIKAAVGSGDPANDRTLTNQFDADGRITTVTGDAGYFVDFGNGGPNVSEAGVRHVNTKIYNAFGEVVQERDLLNAVPGVYADTYHYFDNGGREIYTVDALGYLTARTFDVFDNVTKTIEYTLPQTGWALNVVGTMATTAVGGTSDINGAYDRTTSDSYDRLNRKTSESRDLSFSTTDNGSTPGTRVTTTWGYDALGNVTRTTDALNNSTYNLYDALGRLAAVEMPGRPDPAGGGNLQPVVEYSYDAFGQQTVQRTHVNSATGVGEFIGVWTAASHPYASASNDAALTGDKVIRTQYDNAGRVAHIDDAMGTATYREYTLDGRLSYTWHVVAGKTIWQGTSYDAVGQVLHVYSASPDTARAGQDTTIDYHYNAFGEVDQKGIDGGMQEFFSYNQQGQVWMTNTSGIVHVYLHDMQGRVTADITSAGMGRGDVDVKSVVTSEAIADSRTDLRRTNTVYDKLGRAVRTEQPERAVTTGGIGLNAAPVAWSVATAPSPNDSTVTFTWPSLNYLGGGDVRVWFAYTTKNSPNITPNTQQVFDAGAGASGATFTMKAGDGGIAGVVSVAVSKKDVFGNWVQVYWQTAPATSGKTWGSAATYTSPNHSLIEVIPPPGSGAISGQSTQIPAVTLKYQGPGMSTFAQASLSNFGSEYAFDAATLAAGTYSYTLTYVNWDGTQSSLPSGTFTVGTAMASTSTSLWTRPIVYQGFDRWGNVVSRTDPDSARWITTYHYDANNQLIWQRQPDSTGTAAIGPLTQIFYDALGRQLATIDADLNMSGQVVDAAGNVIETHAHPSAGVLVKTTAKYDIFGRKVLATSGDGFDAATGNANSLNGAYTTQTTYDLNDHVLQVQHGTDSASGVKVYLATGSGSSLAATSMYNGALQQLKEKYTYDEDGHRLTSFDGTLSNSAGNAELTTTYTYDVAGNLIATAKPLLAGQTAATATTTSFTFDDYGHKKFELDPDQNTETWQYDYFGLRILAHKDLGGYIYNYTYDNAGQLTHEINQRTTLSDASLNQSRFYDAAGQQTRVWDAGTFTNTAYTFDLAGRRLSETTSSIYAVYQDNHLAYDALGRLVDSSDSNVHVSYQYDAVGNRTRVKTTVVATGARALAGDVTTPSDHWYAYDGMNRQTQADWATSGAPGATGHTLTYDADGNRKTDTFVGNKVTSSGGDQVVVDYDEQGNPIYGTNPVTYSTSTGTVTETYTYDTVDRLRETYYDGVFVDNRLYDGAGRTVLEGPSAHLPTGYAAALNKGLAADQAIGLETRINKYDEHGNVLATYAMKSDGTAEYSIDYSNGGSGTTKTGYDAAGNLLGSRMTTYGSGAYTQSTYSTLWDVRESYQQTAQSTSKVQGSTTTNGSTSTVYNNDGNISSFTDYQQQSFSRSFAYDIDGHVLSTLSTKDKHEERELVVNGEVLGTYGVGINPVTPSDANGAAIYKQNAQFELGFRPVTGSFPNASIGSYTVSTGDTLDGIAANAYGDSQQWWRIAQANGLNSNADLRVGTTIVIPSATSGTHNNVGTFEPYDPSKIVGSTSPNLPAPPPPAHGGCGAIGMIVMVVVAVVATVVTCGALGPVMAAALGPALGVLATGAIAGAVSSIASQLVGNAIGATHGFSWKAVATSAIGGAVTLGVGSVGSGVIGAIETAAIDSVVTQGVDMMVGLQKSFSWSSLATSVVAAGVGSEVGSGVSDEIGDYNQAAVQSGGTTIGPTAAKIITGTVGGFAGGVAASLTRGGKLDIVNIAANAFGNALGGAIADALAPPKPVAPKAAIMNDGSNGDADPRNGDNWPTTKSHPFRDPIVLDPNGTGVDGLPMKLDRMTDNKPVYMDPLDALNAAGGLENPDPAKLEEYSKMDVRQQYYKGAQADQIAAALDSQRLQLNERLSEIDRYSDSDVLNLRGSFGIAPDATTEQVGAARDIIRARLVSELQINAKTTVYDFVPGSQNDSKLSDETWASTAAYVHPGDTSHTIYVGPQFFNLDSVDQTMVMSHEMSHFEGTGPRNPRAGAGIAGTGTIDGEFDDRGRTLMTEHDTARRDPITHELLRTKDLSVIMEHVEEPVRYYGDQYSAMPPKLSLYHADTFAYYVGGYQNHYAEAFPNGH